MRRSPHRRTRLRVVNQFFWPDVAATAQLLADLAWDASQAGWRVSALAGTAPYQRSRPTPFPRRERWGQVEVERLPTAPVRGGLLAGFAVYAWFLLRALGHATRYRRGDVVLTLSTPPFVALVGLLARRRGARFVYKVEDLYPDVAVALGALRRSWLVHLLERASAALLRSADAVVVLDEAMRRSVLRSRGREEGLHVVPNWADEQVIRPLPTNASEFRRSLAIPESDLVLGYSGNLGRAHRFDALLAAAQECERRGLPCRFVFTGDGVHGAEIRSAAARLGNVTVRGFQPRERVADVLAASDVQLVSLRPEVEGLLFPSKVPGALAAGRPVLFLGDPTGALAHELESARCGWTVPHDPSAIVSTIERLLADRSEVEAAGRRARLHFERRYTRAAARERWLAILDAQRD